MVAISEAEGEGHERKDNGGSEESGGEGDKEEVTAVGGRGRRVGYEQGGYVGGKSWECGG